MKKSIKKTDIKELNQITDFLFEVGMLQKTPRSGFQFLGSGEQSVAEHLHRASAIAYVLALLSKVPNPHKVVTMAVFHDISEARISDLNYVHQKYNTRLEEKAHKDIVESVPFGNDLKSLIDEYEERQTLESKLVKDADNLEWILSLKEQFDIGNMRAKEWLPSAVARLKTEEGKKLAEVILKTRSDRWWFGDPNDGWWVYRKNDVGNKK
jgi:putative hydrolase of HD superfamily